jgi:hypothetical protein
VLIKHNKINNLEKKPIKGGIPAIEKSEIVIIDKKKKLNLKSAKENKVLKLKLTYCLIVQKINKSDKL